MIIHWTHYLFSYWLKACSEFHRLHLWWHLTADYTIIMSRTHKVTGNHVMYDHGAWFLKEIMSNLYALSCLPSMYNKKAIRFHFCDIQNNQGLSKGYQPQPVVYILAFTKLRHSCLWLACFSPEWAVQVQALAGDIVLCSWVGHLALHSAFLHSWV